MADQNPKKPRKSLRPRSTQLCCVGEYDEALVGWPRYMPLYCPKEARRIAEWLLKWADWKEAQRD